VIYGHCCSLAHALNQSFRGTFSQRSSKLIIVISCCSTQVLYWGRATLWVYLTLKSLLFYTKQALLGLLVCCQCTDVQDTDSRRRRPLSQCSAWSHWRSLLNGRWWYTVWNDLTRTWFVCYWAALPYRRPRYALLFVCLSVCPVPDS